MLGAHVWLSKWQLYRLLADKVSAQKCSCKHRHPPTGRAAGTRRPSRVGWVVTRNWLHLHLGPSQGGSRHHTDTVPGHGPALIFESVPWALWEVQAHFVSSPQPSSPSTAGHWTPQPDRQWTYYTVNHIMIHIQSLHSPHAPTFFQHHPVARDLVRIVLVKFI